MLSSPTDHRCSFVNTSAGVGFCLDRPRTASPTSAAQKICMSKVRSSRTRRMKNIAPTKARTISQSSIYSQAMLAFTHFVSRSRISTHNFVLDNLRAKSRKNTNTAAIADMVLITANVFGPRSGAPP